MKALIAYVLFGLLAYTFFLVAKLPADLAYRHYEAELPVALSGVSGSLWRGEEIGRAHV